MKKGIIEQKKNNIFLILMLPQINIEQIIKHMVIHNMKIQL